MAPYIPFWDYSKTGLVRRPGSAIRLLFVKSTHTLAYRALIDALVDARKAAKLTQHGLAAHLGKPQSYVAKVENRERRLDVIEFIHIVRALGGDPCDIIRLVEATAPTVKEIR
jgi:cyanate lyase